MTMHRFLIPTDIADDAVASALRPAGRVVLGPPVTITATYLDTFDWRLHHAGLTLVEERGRDRGLVLHEPGSEPVSSPTETTPRWPAELPAGHLADRVGPQLGIRALLEMGAAWVVRRDGRVEDGDGNLVSRLRVEQVEPLDARSRPAGEPFAVIRIDGSKLASLLADLDWTDRAPQTDLEAVLSTRGRRPGDYSSKLDIPLEAARPSDDAVRTILLDLLDTVERNVDGTIADWDTEFLHDFRVACRRTRSALTQLKGVLPDEVARRYNTEFKWLGSVTGPLRDLDVYLLEMPVYRSMLPADAATDLDPLERLIRSSRADAHRTVVRALRTTRFATLIADWRGFLAAGDASDEPAARRPVGELARRRIARAHRRILKKGARLDEDPPAGALHRLRIDAKKLRYLLEFFRSLYPEPEIASRIKELKRLQDILGGFNDMEVQRDRLHGFAEMLHDDPGTSTATLLTLGRLTGTLEQRQEQYRLAFHDAFVGFSGGPVREAYDRLFGDRGPS